ncbi:MAG: SGNH/GDSL hydrolase family protein [Myxococcales bacterium]|nr:SGNH/GDSL hydrolase family protein [Myxococcales bacterium]
MGPRSSTLRWQLTLSFCSALAGAACSGGVARGQGGTTASNEISGTAPREPLVVEARPLTENGMVVEPPPAPPEPKPRPPVGTGPAVTDGTLGGAIPIEDPSGRALAAFHAALGRAERREGRARIAFYGASHVASDLFTGRIRQRLQARFGDAGPGFVLPAKPWRWYRHHGVKIEKSRGFDDLRVRARAPKDDIYGLAGVALQTDDKYGRGILRTRKNGGLEGMASRFELYYLKQPNGGTMSVFIDGERTRNLGARAKGTETAYAAFEVEPGHHTLEVRTHGNGPVRLFGVSVERDAPGVILDTLGIPGARARYHLHWDEGVYREHLLRRNPDLIVLAYGTNEAGDDDVPIERYEGRLRQVMKRLREILPAASCLLVGPSDRPIKDDDGSYSTRPRTAQLVESQRRVSAEMGCGFFDLVAFMGGDMSMVRWVATEPPMGAKDHVHFTKHGYVRLGDVLHDALLEGYTATAPAAP